MSDDNNPFRPRPVMGREAIAGVRRARAELVAAVDRTPYTVAAHAEAVAEYLDERGLGVHEANIQALYDLARQLDEEER